MFRTAFSNLACPQWSIEHVAQEAARMGYDAVELRLLNGEVIDPVRDERALLTSVGLCRTRGVEVCAFDTSCHFNVSEPQERLRQVQELRVWIAVAHQAGVPILRIFGGASPQGEHEGNERVVESLRSVAAQAEEAGVTIALETHDAFSSARRVAHVLDQVASPNIAALWDSHHPYRVGESASDVVDALGERIAHVHVKDARRSGAEWQLVLLGEGEVPVQAQLYILAEQRYRGYIAVEWEKKWHPGLAEPAIALPQHLAWLIQHAPHGITSAGDETSL